MNTLFSHKFKERYAEDFSEQSYEIQLIYLHAWEDALMTARNQIDILLCEIDIHKPKLGQQEVQDDDEL